MIQIQPCRICGDSPTTENLGPLGSPLGGGNVSFGCCEMRTAFYSSRQKAIRTWNRWQTNRRQFDLPDNPKIGYDIDGVLANFIGAIIKEAKKMGLGDLLPGHYEEWTTYDSQNPDAFQKVFREIKDHNPFWLHHIHPHDDAYIHTDVHCYITARDAPSTLTKGWLEANKFPEAPVESVGHGNPKVSTADEKNLDLFVDDKASTVQALNAAGIPALLRDRPHNRDAGMEDVRIRSLYQVQKYL